jgi:RimJ/RimL family protein N-acetyltransferase
MNNNLFQGKLVRFVAEDPQIIAEAFSRWSRDSEYSRLLSAFPAGPNSVKSFKDWIEKEFEKERLDSYMFMIRTLQENLLIGEIDLEVIEGYHSDAFVGISIGERRYWDKGYGTDAMNIMLNYAFNELNLHRVSLNVFEYNPRAIHLYEKIGFTVEGRAREFLNRDGRRWDMIFMGILRESWQTYNA